MSSSYFFLNSFLKIIHVHYQIYNTLIEYFTKDDGEIMIDTMLSWAKIAGFHGIRKDIAYHPDIDDKSHYLDRENHLCHRQSNRVVVGC